jgi:hypothetical protein
MKSLQVKLLLGDRSLAWRNAPGLKANERCLEMEKVAMLKQAKLDEEWAPSATDQVIGSWSELVVGGRYRTRPLIDGSPYSGTQRDWVLEDDESLEYITVAEFTVRSELFLGRGENDWRLAYCVLVTDRYDEYPRVASLFELGVEPPKPYVQCPTYELEGDAHECSKSCIQHAHRTWRVS